MIVKIDRRGYRGNAIFILLKKRERERNKETLPESSVTPTYQIIQDGVIWLPILQSATDVLPHSAWAASDRTALLEVPEKENYNHQAGALSGCVLLEQNEIQKHTLSKAEKHTSNCLCLPNMVRWKKGSSFEKLRSIFEATGFVFYLYPWSSNISCTQSQWLCKFLLPFLVWETVQDRHLHVMVAASSTVRMRVRGFGRLRLCFVVQGCPHNQGGFSGAGLGGCLCSFLSLWLTPTFVELFFKSLWVYFPFHCSFGENLSQ